MKNHINKLMDIIPLVLIFIGLACHKLWFDEIHAWQLATHMRLDQLLKYLPFEGHPPFIYLILKFSSFFVSKMEYLKFFLFMIYICLFYILKKFNHLTNISIFLLLTNYFVLFEYGTFIRPYIFQLFFLSLFAYSIKQQSPYIAFASLIFLNLTHFYGMLFSFVLSFYALIKMNSTKVLFVINLVIFLFSIIYITPPASSTFATHEYLELSFSRFTQLLGPFRQAFFPIPEGILYSWNTDLFSNISILVNVFIALGILIFLKYIFHKNIALLFLILFSGLFAFSYIKFNGDIRHHGQYFLAFFVCLLLENTVSKKINFFLAIGAICGIFFTLLSLFIPLNHYEKLTQLNLNNVSQFICVDEKCVDQASYYLSKKVFNLRSMRYEYFMTYGKERMQNKRKLFFDRERKNLFTSSYENLTILKQNDHQILKNAILITNTPLIVKGENLKIIFEFKSSFWKEGDVFISEYN